MVALDADGDELGDATPVAVLSSSVATDIITGNRVHFVTASPHTITATIPGAPGISASLTVQVAPLAVPGGPGGPAVLSATGVGAGASAGALVLGVAALAVGLVTACRSARGTAESNRGEGAENL